MWNKCSITLIKNSEEANLLEMCQSIEIRRESHYVEKLEGPGHYIKSVNIGLWTNNLIGRMNFNSPVGHFIKILNRA